MMLRSGRVLRAVMTLLAFGVALQGAMPFAMRVCAMHGADRAAPVHAEHSAAEHAYHTQTSLPSDVAARTDAPTDAPVHGCDCLTDCCGVPTFALTGRAAPPAASVRASSTAAHHNPAPPRTTPAARLLPFANGPPRSALG
jgi:hypothetical protein